MKYLQNGKLFALIFLTVQCLAGTLDAQTYFTTTGFGDLVAGFRKTGTFVEQNEMVVYLGNITNFIKLSVGTVVNISNYSTVQITNMCPDNLENLQWSAFSAFQPFGLPEQPWATPVGSFPKATCWFTLQRTNVSVQSVPPLRLSYNGLGILRGRILGVSVGARRVSQSLVTTNTFNNSLLVTEPVTYAGSGILTDSIGDVSDPTFGDFGGQVIDYTVENTTPSPFSSAAISDLYQVCPSGYADPLTHSTNGSATYLGYFTLATDGTMTFTRDATNSVVNPPPPPPPQLEMVRSQTTSTISFTTTNGATYTLYYTNSLGLSSPISGWAVLPGKITGDGSVKSFMDSSSDLERFYQVGAE